MTTAPWNVEPIADDEPRRHHVRCLVANATEVERFAQARVARDRVVAQMVVFDAQHLRDEYVLEVVVPAIAVGAGTRYV